MKRSSNSSFPKTFQFEGRSYRSASELYVSANATPAVSLEIFRHRIWRLIRSESLDEVRVNDALFLSSNHYKKQYAVRKTWISISGRKVCLEAHYRDLNSPEVPYRQYWQRVRSLKTRRLLDEESLSDAANFGESDWISFYGGGRHRNVVYTGESYPQLSGRMYRSIASFLKRADRYNDRALIWSRLKAGWPLDAALSVPSTSQTCRLGTIYLLTRRRTGQIYVGLTIGSVDQRWAFHLSSAKAGATTPLAKAIREDSFRGFARRALEDSIDGTERLREREIYWVKRLNAAGPNGLNKAPAGGLGGSKGMKVTIDGVTFPSKEEAAHKISLETGIAKHVLIRRITQGLPIRKAARTRSDHPEAGSNLFRRWLAMKRRGGAVHASWINSFDRFKRDVSPVDLSKVLVRKNPTKPWGPANCEWVSKREKIHRDHGKETVVEGVRFATLKDVADHYGIGLSTLKHRVQNQGLSIDEAVGKPLGATSFRQSGVIAPRLDGKEFRSRREAVLWLMEHRRMTEYRARLYVETLTRSTR